MFKSIPLNILLLSLVLIALASLIESPQNKSKQVLLPWLISQDQQGHSQIFGITLEQTKLIDIQKHFSAEGKTTLFLSSKGLYTLEIYFQSLYLNGIKADIVLNLPLDENRAQQIFQSGSRISILGDGTKRISLSAKDLEQIQNLSPYVLTYLPKANLSIELIQQRFGTPEKIIHEENLTQHWLYPSKGLDIAYHPEAKEVLQYISPASFDKLLNFKP